MACSKKTWLESRSVLADLLQNYRHFSLPALSPLGLPRIWGAIFVQQALLSRIIQRPLLVTKTEHKKESLGISQKTKTQTNRKKEIIFSVPYSCRQTNCSYVCESLIKEMREEISGLALQF